MRISRPLADFPKLVAEWHPTKNELFTPNDVTHGSRKKVWWMCTMCGSEWQARIDGRSAGRGCPYCRYKRSATCLTYGPHVSTKISSCIYHAKLRGLAWELTDEEAACLLISDCHYCSYSCKGKTPLNGIDRVDNTHGYYITNVVSCCKVCNHAKRTMSLTEFYDWLDRLARHQGYEKNSSK